MGDVHAEIALAMHILHERPPLGSRFSIKSSSVCGSLMLITRDGYQATDRLRVIRIKFIKRI
jgi:hypothetical protein